jgi:putative ABC transport system permease protein
MSVLDVRAWQVALAEALQTIRSHPLRASLGGLAMATAVATTIVVETGLSGLAQSARDASARAFGSDSFLVVNVASLTRSRRELTERSARNPKITRADVRFLQRVAEQRVVYAATAQRQADVAAGSRTFENASVNGTQASLFDIRDIGIVRGRAFTADEGTAGSQVAILGDGIASTLFPASDPLGQFVRIAGRRIQVVGLLERQGTGGGVSLDRYLWMPLPAYERAFGAAPSLQVFAKATDVSQTAAAEDRARASMRARRHLGPGEPDTFDIVTPEASRSFVANLTERLGAAAPPISLMALIAAMLVVANTTLVSVNQRTREIGVRRAMGATRAHVVAETLAESAVIALAGGGVGVLVAAAVLAPASSAFGLPLSLDVETCLSGLVAAGVSGMLAGWYPARRAAGLSVIASLGRE